jgi:mutator protein MutT
MARCAFAIIIHPESHEVLLVQIAPPFKEANKWNFPGGVIEEGEDVIDGLSREVHEETGIRCTVQKEIDRFETQNPKNDISIFTAKYLDGELSYQQGELLDSRWFTHEEALAMPLAFEIKNYLLQLNSPTID